MLEKYIYMGMPSLEAMGGSLRFRAPTLKKSKVIHVVASWLTSLVEWCYKHVELLSFLVGIVSVTSLLIDVVFIHLIPKHYYKIPTEGDNFPVHGKEFWSLIAYVFVLNFISTFLATLYGLWKWRKAFVGQLPYGTVMTVTFGLETFLTFTQFLSVLLAIGHLYYLFRHYCIQKLGQFTGHRCHAFAKRR
jgi:hypothetical protein